MGYTKIRPRAGTKSEWIKANPILAEREIGIEYGVGGLGKDYISMKMGDGVTPWNSLTYVIDGQAFKNQGLEIADILLNGVKNPNKLSLNLNGGDDIEYDGSKAISVAITPSAIGAANSSHTHNYAGSSSAGGAALKAEQLVQKLNIKYNGVWVTDFDGSIGTTIDIAPKYINAISLDEKGVAGGVATLGTDGKVPSAQLPSYVDDVLEYSAKSSFPSTGESGKIYIDQSTNKTYRWSGTAYVEISSSLALGTTSSTAFAGDKGQVAYEHARSSNTNPHNTTAVDVGAPTTDQFQTLFNMVTGLSQSMLDMDGGTP